MAGVSNRAKRAILLIASLILCLVWGQRLVSFAEKSELVMSVEAGQNLQTHLAHDGATETFMYDISGPDPFELPLKRNRQRTKQPAARSTMPVSMPGPKAALRGLVWNRREPQLIVFDSLTNSTRIVSNGDTLNEFVVSQITRGRITLKRAQHRVIWNRETTTD